MKNKISATPWRLLNGNCGAMLGIMSAEDRPVAMLGVAVALNPADVDVLLAAPDLLAACEAARAWMGPQPLQSIEGFRVFQELDAAIAKATGEANAAQSEGDG